MPRACPVGGSRSLLHKAELLRQGCHGLVPLEVHVRCYTRPSCCAKDATGLPRGDSRWLLVLRHGYSAVSSEREPPTGQARGISRVECVVAVIVNLQRDKPVASLEF
jgi:hypothetical protein